MKQVTLVSPKKFVLADAEMPKAGAKQALLKIHAVGICGSDIHAYHGKHPFISCPIVTGHEASGEVVEVGAEVANVKVGDRVVIRPQVLCGECLQCKSGRYNICTSLKVLGCQETGASSEYYAVDADLLYVLPDNVPYPEGTVIEPLAVGVHAAKIGLPGGFAGKKVVVIGAGTIGNMVAQSCKGLGAEHVIITDVSDFKLDLAKQCGIDTAVNVAREDLAEVIAEKYGVDGADAIYECTASEAGLNQCLDIARKGSRIVIVGVYGQKVMVNMANVQDREYELVGTLMYLDEDYKDAIRLAAEGKVDLTTPITHSFPLEKTAEAYEFIDANPGEVQKVIINV